MFPAEEFRWRFNEYKWRYGVAQNLFRKKVSQYP